MATEKEDMPTGFHLKVIYALDAQWVKIDDVIKWAKDNGFYEVQKEFIKLKNQKPLNHDPH